MQMGRKKGPSKYMKIALEKEEEMKRKQQAKRRSETSTKRTRKQSVSRPGKQQKVSFAYAIYIIVLVAGGIGVGLYFTRDNTPVDDNTPPSNNDNTPEPPQETYGFDHTVTTIDDEYIYFSNYEDQKVVVLEFMTIDCPACDPMIENLVQVYQDLGSAQLEIFTLDLGGSSVNELDQYRTDHSIEHKISQEGLSLSQYFTVAYTPTTIILDKTGEQYGSSMVGLKTVSELKTAIQGAMAV